MSEIYLDDSLQYNENLIPVADKKSNEQLQRDVEALKEEIRALKEEIFGEGIIEMMGDLIQELKVRMNTQESMTRELVGQVNYFQNLLAGGVNKTTKRAYLLADAVKAADQGFITRAQARNILTENGARPAAKTADDAMQAAAKMFGLIYTKRKNGEVVLAVS
jgi:cell division septum initiation protein DivIVA